MAMQWRSSNVPIEASAQGELTERIKVRFSPTAVPHHCRSDQKAHCNAPDSSLDRGEMTERERQHFQCICNGIGATFTTTDGQVFPVCGNIVLTVFRMDYRIDDLEWSGPTRLEIATSRKQEVQLPLFEPGTFRFQASKTEHVTTTKMVDIAWPEVYRPAEYRSVLLTTDFNQILDAMCKAWMIEFEEGDLVSQIKLPAWLQHWREGWPGTNLYTVNEDFQADEPTILARA